VYDSVPENEYREEAHKLTAMRQALRDMVEQSCILLIDNLYPFVYKMQHLIQGHSESVLGVCLDFQRVCHSFGGRLQVAALPMRGKVIGACCRVCLIIRV
jgi:anthranilate/para-aminobenzoate synthase component II